MKTTIFLLSLFIALSATAQLDNNAPLKLKVGTYNVGHFNQGIASGLETRGGKLLGKEGKQRHARFEMMSWREWIGAQSLDFLCVQEWNKYLDVDSTFHAADELLKPFYNNIHFGDQHTWIYNGIATNYHLSNIRQHYWFGDYYALNDFDHLPGLADVIITFPKPSK